MRSPKILLAAGVLVIAVIAAGLWYRHTRSPEYALQRIAEAVRAKDVQAFERYVDVERTSTSTVDQMIAHATAEAMRESGGQEGLEAMGTALGVQMLQGMKPAMVQAIRTGLVEAVKTGSVDSAFAGQAAGGAGLGSLGAGNALDGLAGVRRSGNSAIADFRVKSAALDTTLIVSARMERVDGTWRLVGPDNLGAFMKSVADVEQRRLAALNDSAARVIRQAAEFGEPQPRLVEEDGTTYLWLEIPVRNRGTVPITWAALILPVGGDKGVQLTMKEELAPGAAANGGMVIEYNPFIPEHKALLEGQVRAENASSIGLALLRQGKPDTTYIFPSWKGYQSYLATHPGRAAKR